MACSHHSVPSDMVMISNMVELGLHFTAENHRRRRRGSCLLQGSLAAICLELLGRWQDLLGPFLPIQLQITTPYSIPDTFLFRRRHHNFSSYSSRLDKKSRKGMSRKKHTHMSFFSISPLSSWALPFIRRQNSSSWPPTPHFWVAKFLLLFADKALVYSSQSINMWLRDTLGA